MTHYTRIKCLVCDNDNIDDYDYCSSCIQKLVRVCTCDKKFITEVPKILILRVGEVTKQIDIPTLDSINFPRYTTKLPDYFFTKIKGRLYHILGCRGCKFKEEISVQNNFN